MTPPPNTTLDTPDALNKRDQCDVAVIGGGLAGSLSAIHLARAGFQVVLFEKEKHRSEKVCGEFLSAESLPLLREVGVDPILLGGVEISKIGLHGPAQSCSFALPGRSIGISHSVLDEELLRIAAESGADVRRGVRVTEILEGLDETTGSILLSTSVGETRAQRLVIATGTDGFHFLNERPNREPSPTGAYVGFKMHIRLKPSCAARLAGHCDLFSFNQGYGGLTDLGHGLANFCFQIEKDALKKLKIDWESLTAHIGKSNWSASHMLDGAKPLASSFTSVAMNTAGFLRRDPAPAGFFFVGDQLAMIPSLTGDGMTIALMTARRAVEAMIEPVSGSSGLGEGIVSGSLGPVRFSFAPHASRDYQRSMRSVLRPQLDSALAVHSLFKNPKLVDVSTYALRAFPSIFRKAFHTTRCRVFEPAKATRLRSWQKRAASAEIAPIR